MSHSKKIKNAHYLKIETIGAAILLAAAIAGFTIGNSPFESFYEEFINFHLEFKINKFSFSKPVLFWINDGLISLFFLFIGLEIKSMLHTEVFSGNVQLRAPISAAILGAIVPAIIFSLFNFDNQLFMRGWAIPTAMDTAFILGILALVGSSISSSMRMFVMSLAIIDDILAVLIIAIFYTESISAIAIVGSAAVVGLLTIANLIGNTRGAIYVALGLALWVLVLASGIHTSIAGVLLAATIPINPEHPSKCLVTKAKNILHPWVSFVILPLFAFANTGFDLEDVSIDKLFNPLGLGIILGLFIGKQLGIFGIIYILERYKVIKLPAHSDWWQMYGVSVLCGVGFTMSLFIGVLAFENAGQDLDDIVKAAVFTASIMSAVCGYLVLYFHSRFKKSHLH
jgi:NhaA family Na+:H+ antiporter